MHKSRLGALVIDCQTDDLSNAVGFWSAALGRDAAMNDQHNPRYVKLADKSGEMQVLLQQVDHPSWVHIDIETDDMAAEVRRLEALGAHVIGQIKTWTVMEAPTGHCFCVVNPVRDKFKQGANQWS